MNSTSNTASKERVLQTSWITLGVLTGLNILNYIDRNIFSALVPAIKADLGFSDTQLGLLGSAFIFSYTLIAPVFGYLGDRGGRMRIMSSGVFLWSLATAATGQVTTFVNQFATRITVGFGEAAYTVISPSVIADHFPKASRGKVFAIYSCAIPVGSALGYVIGGFLEPRMGWRHAFLAVGFPGILLCALLLFLKEPKRTTARIESEKKPSLFVTYASLFKNRGFLFTVLGYAAYTFVVGGLAFWMPAYIVRYFPGVSMEKGNIVFGAVTVLGGFVGTALGGWLSDRLERTSGNGYLKVAALSMALSVPLFIFVLSIRDFTAFASVLFFMDTAIFLCMSPLDAAVINYVRPQFRATAIALNIFLIHALGDGPSRIILGAVSDGHGLQSAISFLPFALALAGLIWIAGFIFAWQPMLWPVGAMDFLEFPRFQAHRGFRPNSTIQENTLESFGLAKQNGALMCELDVHLSKDGVAVVFHDADLKRLAGSVDLVASLTASELKQRANAPTLLEVLSSSGAPSYVNIEIKSDQVLGAPLLEQAIWKSIATADAQARVIVSSFNPFALRRMAKIAPDIPRGLLVTQEPDPKNKWVLRKMLFAFWARPHLLHVDQEMATPRNLEQWMDRSIPVVVWTVNDPARAQVLLGQGVTSIISDAVF
jgi:glycerophosphoryl diester phosphodiesterase/predicted MFS family arabinose efflux permease